MRVRSFSLTSKIIFAAFIVLLGPSGGANAADSKPVVVELFTSQGCYSCPPAEALLGRLSARADVIALEFHVDYWDDLVYGSAGKWKDPFSSAANTQRQRNYNLQIRKTGGVYTPQMVVAGNQEMVGSHENKVVQAIQHSRTAAAIPLTVHVESDGSDALNVQIEGTTTQAASVWMVQFHRNIETKVRSGENKGKTLVSHHIVTQLQKIGNWSGSSLSLRASAPSAASGMGCAILIQQGPGTPILGASYCPTNRSS